MAGPFFFPQPAALTKLPQRNCRVGLSPPALPPTKYGRPQTAPTVPGSIYSHLHRPPQGGISHRSVGRNSVISESPPSHEDYFLHRKMGDLSLPTRSHSPMRQLDTSRYAFRVWRRNEKDFAACFFALASDLRARTTEQTAAD